MQILDSEFQKAMLSLASNHRLMRFASFGRGDQVDLQLQIVNSNSNAKY